MKRFCAALFFLFFLSTFVSAPPAAAQPVALASGYACNSNICDPARRAYAARSASRACAMSRALKRLLGLIEAKKRVLLRLQNQLVQCQLRNQRNPAVCNWRLRRIRQLENAITRVQERIDRLLARTQRACDHSLGIPGQNPQPSACEQEEAGRYCPVDSAEGALDSLKRRCDDLTAEIALAAIDCEPKDPCFDQRAVAFVKNNLGELFETLAAMGSCPVPTPVATATATATPGIAASPVPTVLVTPVIISTVTPVSTDTASNCRYRTDSAPSLAQQCRPVRNSTGSPGFICCEMSAA